MSNQIELTEKVATELAGALARLHELGDSKIINPANEAEITGLRRYISATLPQYANELLGNWFVMRNEYEPMIQGFSALLGRAGALINARQAKQDKQPAPTSDAAVNVTPENVVPLTQ